MRKLCWDATARFRRHTCRRTTSTSPLLIVGRRALRTLILPCTMEEPATAGTVRLPEARARPVTLRALATALRCVVGKTATRSIQRETHLAIQTAATPVLPLAPLLP